MGKEEDGFNIIADGKPTPAGKGQTIAAGFSVSLKSFQ